MKADDVLEVLDLLDGRGVRFWIDGGWGVDALLGEQTRPHADLDLAVELQDRDLYEQAVADAGFEFLYFDPCNDDEDGNHLNWVVEDSAGRRIDVHLVDTRTKKVTSDGDVAYGAIPYPVGSLKGTGAISGRSVRCVTAEFQMRSHVGYEIADTDIHDVAALHRRFDLRLPHEYEGLIDD